MNETKKASAATPERQLATPLTKVEIMLEVPSETFWFALEAPDQSTPASSSHPGSCRRRRWRSVEIWSLSRDDAAEHEQEDHYAENDEPSRTSTAPAAHGAPFLQPGHDRRDTVATTPPITTGSAIVDVMPSTQAHEEHSQPDEEPRREAEVAQPPRCGEHGGHLAQLAQVERDRKARRRPAPPQRRRQQRDPCVATKAACTISHSPHGSLSQHLRY